MSIYTNQVLTLSTQSASLTLAERKRLFLNGLASPGGKRKYKRYMGAPIRYAGGKSLAVGNVVKMLV